MKRATAQPVGSTARALGGKGAGRLLAKLVFAWVGLMTTLRSQRVCRLYIFASAGHVKGALVECLRGSKSPFGGPDAELGLPRASGPPCVHKVLIRFAMIIDCPVSLFEKIRNCSHM